MAGRRSIPMGPRVRIRLAPADSPSLARFLLPVSKSRQLPRCARARPGDTAGRNTQGSSTSRQLPVTSLLGAFPVPQCRLAELRRFEHFWEPKYLSLLEPTPEGRHYNGVGGTGAAVILGGGCATPSASRICGCSTLCAPAARPAGTRRSSRTRRYCGDDPATRV